MLFRSTATYNAELSPAIFSKAEPITDVKVGVQQEWKDAGVTVSADRTYARQKTSIGQHPTAGAQLQYDRVGVVIDTSDPEKQKAYLKIGSDLYRLGEGNAVAIRNAIKAVVPTERLGTFTVAAEMGKVISNKSKDPFYQMDTATSVSFDWKKQIDKMTEVGLNVSRTQGTQITPFGVIGPVTPVMATSERKVRGMVYLHMKY